MNTKKGIVNEQGLMKCTDSDPACPVCHGECTNDARVPLTRIDYNDGDELPFCYECASDAMESGVFTVLDTEDGE